MTEDSYPALEILGVSKTFGTSTVLDALTLEIQQGEVHALVGENGSGKSTAIKILSGYHRPDPGGAIRIRGQQLSFGASADSYASGLRFVHQDVGLIDSCSVLDNLAYTAGFPTRFSTIRTRQAVKAARRDLLGVGLDIDPKSAVADLSPSEKTGVAIARAIRVDPDAPAKVLILDEPTAQLPAAESQRLLDIIKNVAAQGLGVLFVSHHIDEIFQIAQNVTVLRDGKTVACQPVSALDHKRLINLLIGREFDEIGQITKHLRAQGSGALLNVTDLSAGPVTSLSFSVAQGEIVGIAGLTGSGRETVLPAIFGAVPRRRGTVQVEGGRPAAASPSASLAQGIAYLPRDRRRQGGILGHSARENISITDVRRFWRFPTLRTKMEKAEARGWFDRLDVRPAGAIDQTFGSFSGGNQQKIVLAKLLRRDPQVLLLDEPTQGVDVGAKALIHRQIIDAARAGSAVVVCSVEDEELVALCQRVLVLRHGDCVAQLAGDQLSVGALVSASLVGNAKEETA